MSKADQLARLQARLDAIPQTVRDAVKPQLKASGDELVAEMKRLCPIDSGALRDSIVATPGGQSTPANSTGGSHVVAENAFAVTAGNEKVHYAALANFGTSKAPANPFFTSAYRGLRGKIMGDLKSAIIAAVRGKS